MKTIRTKETTWPEVKTAIEAGFTTAVVGVGSTEQHGPHLPTMTDARIGDELARRVALGLGHALQARAVAVGVSEHRLAFAGTLSVTPETLPGHGGNLTTAARTIAESRKAHPGIDVTGYTDPMEFVAILNGASAETGVPPGEAGLPRRT